MSTLMSSSPSISPSPRAKPYHYSPAPSRAAPPNSSTHHQRRALHSPAPSSIASLSPKTRLPRDRAGESNAPREPRPRYADAGTQYSPDGYPPTAGHKSITPLNEAQQHISTPGRKRKEDARSEEESDDDDSSESTSPHMSAAPLQQQPAPPIEPPPEPPLRADPQPPVNRDAEPPSTSSPVPSPREVRTTAPTTPSKRPRPSTEPPKIMPRAYETCSPKDLGVLISSMLLELIRLNDQIPLHNNRLTRFHSRAPPGISVSDYLQRLIQHATLPPPILLSMVYYIDRLCACYSAFTINSLTVHRFLITAATVAAKGLSDSFWTNPTYARIGGIPVSELATLELEFLQKCQWKIVPKPETLVDYYLSLVGRTEGYVLEGEEISSGESGMGSAGSSLREMEREMEREEEAMDTVEVDREPT
nr:hypothetical protein B0A51_18257 [Rachicladosporium sp. CCFEE 5018]